MNSLKVEKSDKTDNINDLKIFLLCISSGAIGFSLIGILPYEIPLFLRVLIAFLFLGIPLMDSKKIVLFGIAAGLGFFIKDYIFWDLFSFRWTTAYSNAAGISLFTGLMLGTFFSVALWNRKAIGIFPLTGALAFSGFLAFIFNFFLSFLFFITSPFISGNFDFFRNSDLEAGIMITLKSDVKQKIAYFILGLVVLSIFQIVVIAQPAMGQCVEPARQQEGTSTAAIETIIVDNSYHHLGNDFKEELTAKEPEGVIYAKSFLLDSGFESPELVLMAKSVSPYEINATEYMDRVYINDVAVALLNCYFKPIPASLFSMDTKLTDFHYPMMLLLFC